MQVINPATNRVIGEYHEHTPAQVDEIIQEVSTAAKSWSTILMDERAACMRRLANLLREKVESCARLICLEMGKPIQQARSEVLKSASACDYYAEHAHSLLKPEEIQLQGQKSTITFEPLGVILGIMPWNFPIWQVMRFGVPTLMAGNGIILKHAPNVPGSATAIESLVAAAGFPRNLLRSVRVSNDRVADIISDDRVNGVALTGSERAGISVGAHAGKMLKKCVLELGGSDPYIVLDDADLDECIKTAVNARLANAGQSCIAAKRFIVSKSVLEPFCAGIQAQAESIKLGDPLLDDTEMGPLAREDLLCNLERQVNESVKKGAKIVFGGKRLDADGFFYPPTMLTNISKDMPVYYEETFGPVFVILPAETVQEAIELANDSAYGLGASIWTRNRERAEEVARNIQAGMICINSKTVSNIALPFGGVKKSGHGRELSHYGIKEFVNVKTVVENWWAKI